MSGSISADIYAQANKPTVAPINPLDLYAKAGQITAGMNANKLFQAQTARGELMQQAIGPDGKYDPAKFNALAAADPRVAQVLPDAIDQSQTLTGQQQDQAAKRNQAISQVVGAALKAPPGQTHDMAAAGVQQLIDTGVIPRDEGMQTLAKLPNDEGQLRTLLTQYQTSLLPAQQQREATVGTTGTFTDQSGKLAGYRQLPGDAPGGPAVTPTAGGAPQGPSPDNRAGLVEIQDPKGPPGQTILVRNAQIPGSGGAPAGSQPSPLGTGRPAPGSPLLNPNAPPGSAAPTDAPVIKTANPQQAAANKADQEAYQADQRAIPTGQTAVQSLQKAQHALELTRTGQSTGAVHELKSFLVAQGFPGAADLDESVSNYDMFKKYALDYARRTAGGAGTNLQLEAAEGSNANPGVVSSANRSVLQTNIGRERQKIAMNMEAPDKQTGLGYTTHTSQFATNTDPRGFAFDSYTPPERDKMVAGMTDTERKKYYKSVGIANRLGLLNPQ